MKNISQSHVTLAQAAQRVSILSRVAARLVADCSDSVGAVVPTADAGPSPGHDASASDAEVPDAGAVDRMVNALGGRQAILAATSEVVTSTSQRFDPGEAPVPGTARLVSNIGLTETSLLGTGKSRADLDIGTLFPGPAALKFTEVRVGNGGYVSGLDNVFAVGSTPPPAAIPAARAAAAEKHSDLFSILRLVRQALAEGSLVDDGVATLDGTSLRAVKLTTGATSGHAPVRLLLDDVTSLPVRASTVENHPPLGDTLVEVSYENFRNVAGLTLPFKATLRFDGTVTQTEDRSAIVVNGAVAPDAFAFPQGVTPLPDDAASAAFGQRSAEWLRSFGDFGLPLFYGLQSAGVMPDPIAPGVTVLRGPSHHSLLIEMSDHLIVVEAPLYEEWTSNVLAAIKAVSAKPLKKVVLTHFHFDHTGGVRELAAEPGVAVIAPAGATAFFQEVFKRPHTLHPDRFATSGAAAPTVQGVGDTQVLSDSAGRVVELRTIPNSHVGEMIAVYLPQEKILFEADLFSPGFPTNSPVLAGELYDAIVAQKLVVDKIVGAHGGVVSLPALKAAVGR